ncbi:MAG: extracellular solute-binding protein [Paenibacillus dendritiformis]|uniref:ABC transporter substrate-binding protein n=1 Tax=Paenibacillus dendritiformis TaxID=130049 RepID=UPI00143E0D7E|nr:extracellular solute-binding protein [Paenibacillus dendritiformis]MDU5144566.1 extracellular solute-binding protein [Paenibacillus dendritiformis]NKI21217.1 extracellular solute-binding protein [Paenibacillus dendritiformis]NRF98626.1 extracellular solute-binding protein [Paenibacillus dendritiformis]GIO76204.1 sugar ABC transporter substrate-binding protein [Paenibacillus dendritiformis]
MASKRKRYFLISTCILLAFMMFTSACGSKAADESAQSNDSAGTGAKEVTLKYYNWDNEAQEGATDAMLREFEAANPGIKVEHVVLVPGNSLEMLKKLDFLISSGDEVDVVQLPSSSAVVERAVRSAFMPLNEFYDKEGLKAEDEYYVNPQVDGKYYGMQYTSGYTYVMLNKDALDEAGLPVPKFGWTWDDYRDYAKKLTKGEGVDKRYGTYFHTWELYMNAPAQTVMKDPFRYDDGSTILSDPTYPYFFQLRKDMESVDKSAKTYADVLAAKLNYRSEFFGGSAAMIMSGSFTIPDPGNLEQYPHDFVTAFAPVPLPPQNALPKDYEGGKYFVGGSQLAMGATTKHKEEAYKLMRFMSTADSTNRQEFSGWKKADQTALLERMIGKNTDKYDVESLKYTLFGDDIKYLDASKVLTVSSADLTKVIADGFSKFMLSNEPIDKVQAWMVEEATKIINEKENK